VDAFRENVFVFGIIKDEEEWIFAIQQLRNSFFIIQLFQPKVFHFGRERIGNSTRLPTA